jgi:hypothetical protein
VTYLVLVLDLLKRLEIALVTAVTGEHRADQNE